MELHIETIAKQTSLNIYKIVSLHLLTAQGIIVLLLRAKNNPNCSFCDKSMKLPRMTNLYKVNIF